MEKRNASTFKVKHRSVLIKTFRRLEHPTHPFNASSQDIDFFFRIIKAERRTNGTFDAETNHQRLGTMMAGAYGNTETVKQGTHIEVMDVTY